MPIIIDHNLRDESEKNREVKKISQNLGFDAK